MLVWFDGVSIACSCIGITRNVVSGDTALNVLAVADLDTTQPPTDVLKSQICCLQRMTAWKLSSAPQANCCL